MNQKKILFPLLILFLLTLACVSEMEATPEEPTEEVTPTETETPIAYPTTGHLTPTPPFQPDAPGLIYEIPMRIGYGTRGSFYEVYFTDPLNPLGVNEEDGLDKVLVKAIEEARLTIDLAIYSMSLDSLRVALLDARDRGVRIRLVMESENLDKAVPDKLNDAGFQIVDDKRESLMHNKFIVIDGRDTWLGSMNFTYEGVYQDNNNLVRIRSRKIAENYTKEFDEMYNWGMFGEDVVNETPNPVVTIDNIRVETYFSPDDQPGFRIIELLKGARRTITFMAFSFTTDDFGEIIRQKARRGVQVSGIMEDEQTRSNVGTEFDPFRLAGLAVYRDRNEGQMHHKVIIIDNRIVIFGSYNFSLNAERRNDENLMIIFDPQFAALFTQEFMRVYEQTH